MKIGILTFQETNNYGAIWQNFALQRALEKMGVNAETIDYRSKYIGKPYRLKHLQKKGAAGYLFGMAGYFSYLLREKKNRLFRRYIHYSDPVEAEGLVALNSTYDKFITGSDQVWNGYLTDYDDAYCLGFVKDSSKKVSYAASFGRKEPEEKEQIWYMNCLADFWKISVREKSAGHLLKELLGRDVLTVLDPVFLLDRKAWKRVSGKRRLVREKYILVYQLGISRELIRFAAKCAKQYECRLIFLPFPLIGITNCKCMPTAGAGEALNAICHAEYVITDSFHGMALSIIFQKKFAVLANGTHSRVNARILDLLDLLGLKERAWQKHMDLDREICWDCVFSILNKERRRSYQYLKEVTGS